MAHCGASVNCTEIFMPITRTVLPDIVGIGILASFLITAGTAFLTLILSYFLDFLPGDYLTWADWGFLQTWHFRKCCRLRYRAESNRVGSNPADACRHINPNVDMKRRNSLTAFVLSLSDQQLVTGLAMITAALSQRCQLSAYEFQVVNSMAWLASTTHLATLIILRNYFRENRVVRNIRVVGMTTNAVLLFYSTIISLASYYVDKSASIQCVMDDLSSFWPGFVDSLGTLTALLFLVANYVDAIYQLYADPARSRPFENWLHNYCCKRESGPNLSDEEFDRWYITDVLHSKHQPGSEARRDRIWRSAMIIDSGKQSLEDSVRHKVLLCWAILHDYNESFLSGIPSLLMNMSYCITQVIMSRMEAPSIQGSENTVDFGQIVPLFLLALPCLAALEMYFEGSGSKYEAHRSSPNKWPSRLKALSTKVLSEPTNAPTTRPYENKMQGNSDIELSILQPGPSLSDANLLQTQWVSQVSPPASGSSRPIISGLAKLKGSNQAIAVDPRLLYPYSRKEVNGFLDIIFFASACISISTGVLLWFESLYGLLWGSMTIAYLTIQAVEYLVFVGKIISAARKLRKGDQIPPARGTRAPSPSIFDGSNINLSAKDSGIATEQSESPTRLVDSRDITDANRIIQALPPPPIRQSTGFQSHAAGDIGRRPARQDTEATIGLDLYGA